MGVKFGPVKLRLFFLLAEKAQIARASKKKKWAGRVPNPFPVAGPIRPVRRPVRYISLPKQKVNTRSSDGGHFKILKSPSQPRSVSPRLSSPARLPSSAAESVPSHLAVALSALVYRYKHTSVPLPPLCFLPLRPRPRSPGVEAVRRDDRGGGRSCALSFHSGHFRCFYFFRYGSKISLMCIWWRFRGVHIILCLDSAIV